MINSGRWKRLALRSIRLGSLNGWALRVIIRGRLNRLALVIRIIVGCDTLNTPNTIEIVVYIVAPTTTGLQFLSAEQPAGGMLSPCLWVLRAFLTNLMYKIN